MRRLLLSGAGGALIPDPPDPDPDPVYTDLGQWTVPEVDPEIADLPYAIPTSAPYNVPEYISLPVVDGSGQSVHPSVLDFHPREWNGYRYWMGVTGYKDGLNRHENPHIFASHDGYDWELPPGCPAPIDPSPGTVESPDNPLNSDTELVYDPTTDRLHLFWREAHESAPYEKIWRVQSDDGSTWSEPSETLAGYAGYVDILSPTIVRLAPGQWRMWATRGFTGGVLRYWDATSPTGPWTLGGNCTLTGAAQMLWHLNVTRVGDRLYMAGDDFSSGGIFPAISDDDGITWTFGADFITASGGGWDINPYRATLFLHPDLETFRVWYSATAAVGWWSAYTHTPRSLWDDLA